MNKQLIVGFNFGYNIMNFDEVTGSTINLGLYGTYDWKKYGRAYANANLAIHSGHARVGHMIDGQTKSDMSAVDVTLDTGILHKIFDQYATGRGYLTFGLQGGYGMVQKYKGLDFIDLSADSRLVLAPGYEILLGKDIWMSVSSFVRPSLRLGIEYDLLGNENRDIGFKFSEVDAWRVRKAADSDNWWLRWGAQIDISFMAGTNISIGYEVLKNGGMEIDQFKLSGFYRF
jgi:hypothetical protein